MRRYTLIFGLLLLLTSPLTSQIDFYGRSLTGQSPNNVSTYLLLGLSNGSSIVSSAANLKDFDHAARQLNLFNLGIAYASQVLEIDSLEEIQINLDTVIGGPVVKNAFRLYAGFQYEAWDRDVRTLATLGPSRFGEGGFSIALSHEVSLLPSNRVFQLIPALARDQSLFVSIYGAVEAGFDTGFSITLEESGILQLVTDNLVRDVAEGKLTFEEYKSIERQLYAGLRYQAPKNTGGSEWYALAMLKGRMYVRPFSNLPLQFSLGLELGLDIARLKKRNQNRFGFFINAGYLLY